MTFPRNAEELEAAKRACQAFVEAGRTDMAKAYAKFASSVMDDG